jgi:hypothetical protein
MAESGFEARQFDPKAKQFAKNVSCILPAFESHGELLKSPVTGTPVQGLPESVF